MAFITRLSRLMRADLHALLDRLEAPELVIAQALREMEQAHQEERRSLARLDRERAGLSDRAAELKRVLDQTAEALSDVLDAGQDDLARPLIRRQLETEQQASAIRQRLQGLERERERQRQRLTEQEQRLADLRARAAMYEGRVEPDSGREDDPWPDSGTGVRDADVEVALLRAKRQRGLAS